MPESANDDSERLVRKVCRLAHRLSKMAENTGDRESMARMLAYPRRQRNLSDKVEYIAFLDTIVAAPFVSKKTQ